MRNLQKLSILGVSLLTLSLSHAKAQTSAFNVSYAYGIDQFSHYETYSELQGEPFLLQDWAKGTAITNNKDYVNDILILYNEVEDKLIVKIKKDRAEDFKKSEILGFTILDVNKNKTRLFSAGFAPTKETDNQTYFEVLLSGKIKLLKKNIKIANQSREYSGKIATTILSSLNYYVVGADNKPVRLNKLNEKAVHSMFIGEKGLFADKAKELDEFIDTNKLKFKDESELIALIEYYNSLA